MVLGRREGVAVYQVRHRGGMAMYFGVRKWRWSNTVDYIGKGKVEGSIHGGGEFIWVAS